DCLYDFAAHMKAMLSVYNKSDSVDEDLIAMYHPSIFISAYDGTDVQRLLLKIDDMLSGEWDSYAVNLNLNIGRMLYRLQHETIITNKFFDEEKNQYTIQGYMPQEHPLQGLLKEN